MSNKVLSENFLNLGNPNIEGNCLESTEKLKSLLKKLSVWSVFVFGFLFFYLSQNSNILFAEAVAVTFEYGLNDFEDSYDEQSIEFGQEVKDPGRAYATGYYFLGWYTTGTDGQATDEKFNFNQPITSDTTVTAKWAAAIKDGAGDAYIHTDNNLKYYLYQIPEGSTTKNIAQLIGYDSEPRGDITIPDTVSCDNIEYTVTEIGEKVFSWCRGLKSVKIGRKLESFYKNTFYYCTSLSTIEITGSEKYFAVDNVVYEITDCDSKEARLILFPIGHKTDESPTKSFAVPDKVSYTVDDTTTDYTVTEIGDWAFKDCIRLEIVEMTSVTSIGEYVFEDCVNLTSLITPGVTSIGEGAFFGCSILEIVEMPSVTSVGKYVFECCDWLEIVMMPRVTSIDDGAFLGCIGLKLVVADGNVVLGNDVFNDCGNYQTVVFEDGEGNELQTQFVFTDGLKPAKANNPNLKDPTNPGDVVAWKKLGEENDFDFETEITDDMKLHISNVFMQT